MSIQITTKRRRAAAAAVGALVTATALMLAGCSSGNADAGNGGDSGDGEKKTIGVSMSFVNQFYAAVQEGMEDEAEKQGYELVILNAQGNSSTQVNQVQNLVSQGVGSLIFIQLDAASGGASVGQANTANIPVIAVDQLPAGGDYVTFIGSDNVAMGEQACGYLAELLGGEGNIALVEGIPASSTQMQRTEGCQTSLDANPDLNVVSTTSADWDQNKAVSVFANVLTANEDLQGVFAQNDDMALGVASAAETAGRSGLAIVTIDGFPAAYDAIEKGQISATISQQPYLEGQLAVQNAIKAMNGEESEIPKDQIQESILVTKDNLEEARAAKYFGSQG
ncbi:sugar ABC transporter substrate-binding protein [Microbacterium sp. SSM24]|uniref:sugar ABC transporter substrate-binding protein n=1 Tax=Microbacterium sp. SSM24 TaxID=2991714 RepID=UPI002227205B|nr:sugar ABC transporter substrate-binding protein [Microbacterium sp. SSM24]MCW3492713.1 sugar ABC transporter substrate-binding protein [Microbacterium sp. SSM24]